jgi:hypothetical protein
MPIRPHAGQWRRRLCVALLLPLITAPAAAEASARNASRQLGKHEHGTGTLNVAQDGNALVIELDGPADNLLGFERPPRDAAERATLDRVTRLLRGGTALFHLPPQAECRLVAVDVELPAWASGGDSQSAPAGEHADLGGSYEFSCGNPRALDQVEVRAFALFPGLRSLAASVVGQADQSAVKLTPAQPVLRLQP